MQYLSIVAVTPTHAVPSTTTVCTSRHPGMHKHAKSRPSSNATRYMDNGFEYWLVPETMSINANNSNVTLHAARVDFYDYDKLSPPGNVTDLAEQLFDGFNATAGPAYLGTALTVDDIIMFPNLQSIASYIPLAPYMGKRLMIAFRYSTTVYYLSWGIDNVSIIECDDSLGFPLSRRRMHL